MASVEQHGLVEQHRRAGHVDGRVELLRRSGRAMQSSFFDQVWRARPVSGRAQRAQAQASFRWE
jgi:hypothetical protein